MPLYEHIYLARQDISAQQVGESLTARFKAVINPSAALSKRWNIGG